MMPRLIGIDAVLHTTLALAVAAFSVPAGAQVESVLLVQVPAVLEEGAPISNKVDNECDVPELVGREIFNAVARVHGPASAIASPGQAGRTPVLALTVLSAHGVGGGGWSGRKSISVRVDFLKDGKLMGSKVFTASSRGGIGGVVNGTCYVMDYNARSLGKLVARWIPTAVMQSRLMSGGESRVAVQVPALVDPAAPVLDGLETKCALPNLIGNHVYSRVSAKYPGARRINEREPPQPSDKVVRVTILNTQVVLGGGWTGAKGVMLQADLIEDSKVIATNVFQRSASTTSYSLESTCAILERVSANLAIQVANWLPAQEMASDATPVVRNEEEPVASAAAPGALAERAKGAPSAIPGAVVLSKAGGAPTQSQPPAPGMPSVGSTWKYSFRDEQFGGAAQVFTVEATGVDGTKVRDMFKTQDGSVSTVEIEGREAAFLARPLGNSTNVVELAPYPPYPADPQTGLATRPARYPDASGSVWKIGNTVLTDGEEVVPAGRYRVLRAQVSGVALSGAGTQAPGRFVYTIWYAPEVKRYVKIRHQTWNRWNQPTGDEIVELVEYHPGN